MDVRIVLPESVLQAERLRQALGEEFTDPNQVALRRGDDDRYRGVDPTIVVAVVAAVGGALSAFIAGLLNCAQQARSEKIIIQKGEKRIEITPRVSAADLQRAAEFFATIDDEGATVTFDNESD